MNEKIKYQLTARSFILIEPKNKKEEEVKPDKSFELELWTWDEYEVPTLQTRGRYFRPQYSKYIYDIASSAFSHPVNADSYSMRYFLA